MKKTAIIVAGGTGTRMKQDIPKQFIRLQGIPVLMHTISVFHSYDPAMELIVALPPQFMDYWHDLCAECNFVIDHQLVAGGLTRFDTVKNSLAAVHHKGLVAIHDGVRPLVSHAVIDRCFAMADKKGAAIPCIPVNESLRIQNNDGSKPIDRASYRLIQTPQVFQWEIIKKAYETKYSSEFTDDAGVVEKAGFPVQLVEGNPENIKITTLSDLMIAEALMKNKF